LKPSEGRKAIPTFERKRQRLDRSPHEKSDDGIGKIVVPVADLTTGGRAMIAIGGRFCGV
jgi:hypothetical protein